VVDDAAAEVGATLLSGAEETSGLEETRWRSCFTLADLDLLWLQHVSVCKR
jgi:hypothetical protein